jgi:hypothetical protein
MSTTSTSHRVTKPKTQKRKKKTMSYDAAFPLDPAILASTSTMTPSTASTAMNTTSINDSDLQPQNLTATPSQLLTLSTFIASHPSSNVATTLTAILRTSLTPTDFAALQLAATATLARERELRQQALLRELDKLEGKVLGMLREGMGRYCFMKDVEKMGHGFEVLEGMEMVSRIWGRLGSLENGSGLWVEVRRLRGLRDGLRMCGSAWMRCESPGELAMEHERGSDEGLRSRS